MASVDETELSEIEGFTTIEEIVEEFPVPKTLRRSILVKPQVLMGSGTQYTFNKII